MNEQEPGQWAMSHGERSMILVGQSNKTFEGAQVDLLRSIPIPDREVPLAEILAFKQKRGAELFAFRSEMDALIAQLEGSSDHEADLQAAMSRIDRSCRDLIKVGGEWQYPVRLSNWKCNLELKPFATFAGATTAWLAAPQLDLNLTGQVLASLAGGALATTSALKITAEPSWVGLKKTSPYLYVSQFHKEVF